MIVNQALYIDGQRSQCGDLSETLVRLRTNGGPGDFLWVGLKDPGTAEFAVVNQELGLHPLTVEEAVAGRLRVKMERFGEHIVVLALRPLRYIEAGSDIETGELMVIVGDRFVLTVRRGEASPLDGVRQQLETRPELLRLGPMAVLYRIVDHIVDDYEAIDDEILADIESIENMVFSDDDVDTATIYQLKREVLEFKRAVAPLTTHLRTLFSPNSGIVEHPELQLRFRDVSAHAQGVLDHVDAYDRLLGDILTAHLAAVGVRQNAVAVQQNSDMRKISAWAAIAAVPTMIAGVYGMNFAYIPELTVAVTINGRSFQYGYFVILAVMFGAGMLIYRAFNRSGWL